MRSRGRLIVVSNRLPITIEDVGGVQKIVSSGGGLVSALAPILRQCGGNWIGSTGAENTPEHAQLIRDWCATHNYAFTPVFLTEAERAAFYQGFSNEIIWPLFHGLPSKCKFDAAYWQGYCKATDRFADTVKDVSQKQDFIWVHDYHLMKLADVLRDRGMTQGLGYFHHIPFPPPDVFEALPWRQNILSALMRFNLLGFQTGRDRRNFIACVRHCLSGARVTRIGEQIQVRVGGRSTLVGTYPISIDYEEFSRDATRPDVVEAAHSIRRNLANTRIVLGVDRLDYTKGICERLNAFMLLLERHPDLRGKVTMVQIVVPSRQDIPGYAELKLLIETLVSRINGKYATPGWVPVHYLYRSLSRTELVGFYKAAHIALVTPLKDGMNLVAKEFCASRVDNRGVLVLSEFAGAAEELRSTAMLVNPHDAEGVTSTLCLALQMPEAEQARRMALARNQIRKNNVFKWARSFTSFSEQHEDSPAVEELIASATG